MQTTWSLSRDTLWPRCRFNFCTIFSSEPETVLMIVNCPTCKKPVEWIEANTYRPFCSDRCRLIDLGAWASEDYRIPSAAPVSEDDLIDAIEKTQH